MVKASLYTACFVDFVDIQEDRIYITLYPEWQHRKFGCLVLVVYRSMLVRFPSKDWPICTVQLLEWVGEHGQSIGSTVFDAIVRNWLWLTASIFFTCFLPPIGQQGVA